MTHSMIKQTLHHGEWLIQISTIGSLQHATMLQCDKGFL